MSWVSLGTVIDKNRKKFGLDNRNLKLFDIWKKCLGKLAEHIELIGIENGEVLIKAKSSMAQQEVQLRKQELINLLNEGTGSKLVKDIIVHNLTYISRPKFFRQPKLKRRKKSMV